MSSLLNLSLRPCLGKQACWLAGEGAPELPCSAASAVHDSLVLSYSGLFQVGRHPGPHLTNTRIISTTCTLSCKLPFTTGPQKHRPRHIRRRRGANHQSERRHSRPKVRQRAGRAQRGAEHTASKQKEQQWSALRPQFVHRATHHLAIRARRGSERLRRRLERRRRERLSTHERAVRTTQPRPLQDGPLTSE